MINKSIFDILHPDDHPRFNALLLPMAIGNGLTNSNCWPSSSSMVDQMNASSSFSSSSSFSTSTLSNNNNNLNSYHNETNSINLTNTSNSDNINEKNSNNANLNSSLNPIKEDLDQDEKIVGSKTASGTKSSSLNKCSDNIVTVSSHSICSGSSLAASSSSTTAAGSSLIGTLASLNNSSSHNEFNSFNSRFLVKMESPSSIHDDDDDFDFDDSLDESLSHHIDDKNFSDSLSFDDNEALASDPSKGESFASTEALKDKQLTLSEEKRKRILMLKRKKQKQQSSKDSLLPCLPRYELMQVNTRFISNSESKQIDTLTTINNLKHHTSSFGLGSLNSSSMHTDCASSIHHHQQMIEESRVLCVARRLPDSEQQPIDNDGQNNVQIEQFTTRLDFHGRVTFLDTSSMSTKFSWNINYLKNNLINNLLHDFVHPDDLKKVQQHLKEAIINGSVQAAISKFYRLKVCFFF